MNNDSISLFKELIAEYDKQNMAALIGKKMDLSILRDLAAKLVSVDSSITLKLDGSDSELLSSVKGMNEKFFKMS